jgi:hypothetical protein
MNKEITSTQTNAPQRFVYGALPSHKLINKQKLRNYE